nr:CD151 antigen-like isoform X2 [Leptinotarsa decemlineata]
MYTSTACLFLATGCLVIFVFFVGCCAIPKHWTKILFCYIILLVAIFLFETLIAVLAFIFQETFKDDMNLNSISTMVETYKFDESKTASIDYIQENLHCCGAVNYLDWERRSPWIQNETVTNKVPDSCCKTITLGCGKRDHPSNINPEGCMEIIVQKIQSNFWLICAVTLGVGVVHVVGIVFSIVLFLKLERRKLDGNYSPRNGQEALLPENRYM